MLPPVVSTVEVPCGAPTAFTIFVSQMASWWPLAKRSMSMHQGKPPRGLTTDPRPGGQIVETAHDGAQHLWGTFRRVEAPTFVSMDFHMGLPADQASLVEVRFQPLSPSRTRVELTQSNWEAFGDLAEMMRSSYGSSWTLILGQGYREACEAAGA